MEITSLFDEIFGMIPLCGKNVTVFAIRSALGFVIYTW